jgi:peptidoglycan/xylan/chitin deacetylase (PgdA/CDA1 family)
MKHPFPRLISQAAIECKMIKLLKIIPIFLIFFSSIQQRLWSEKPPKQGLITLTFDDGYACHYEIAFPLLQKYDLPATFYVSSGFLEQEDYLTNNQVIEISQKGHEIASHGVSHRNLKKISLVEVKKELEDSKRSLEKLIGKDVENFAPPFGSFSLNMTYVLKSYYKSNRTIIPGLNAIHQLNPWFLRSYVIFNSTSLEELNDWIELADKEKKWLILIYHHINESDDLITISESNFEKQLELIHNCPLKKLTLKDALNQPSQ